MVEVAKVVELVQSGGGLISREPEAIVEYEDKDWDFEGIRTAEKIATSRMRGKLRAFY